MKKIISKRSISADMVFAGVQTFYSVNSELGVTLQKALEAKRMLNREIAACAQETPAEIATEDKDTVEAIAAQCGIPVGSPVELDNFKTKLKDGVTKREADLKSKESKLKDEVEKSIAEDTRFQEEYPLVKDWETLRDKKTSKKLFLLFAAHQEKKEPEEIERLNVELNKYLKDREVYFTEHNIQAPEGSAEYEQACRAHLAELTDQNSVLHKWAAFEYAIKKGELAGPTLQAIFFKVMDVKAADFQKMEEVVKQERIKRITDKRQAFRENTETSEGDAVIARAIGLWNKSAPNPLQQKGRKNAAIKDVNKSPKVAKLELGKKQIAAYISYLKALIQAQDNQKNAEKRGIDPAEAKKDYQGSYNDLYAYIHNNQSIVTLVNLYSKLGQVDPVLKQKNAKADTAQSQDAQLASVQKKLANTDKLIKGLADRADPAEAKELKKAQNLKRSLEKQIQNLETRIAAGPVVTSAETQIKHSKFGGVAKEDVPEAIRENAKLMAKFFQNPAADFLLYKEGDLIAESKRLINDPASRSEFILLLGRTHFSSMQSKLAEYKKKKDSVEKEIIAKTEHAPELYIAKKQEELASLEESIEKLTHDLKKAKKDTSPSATPSVSAAIIQQRTADFRRKIDGLLDFDPKDELPKAENLGDNLKLGEAFFVEEKTLPDKTTPNPMLMTEATFKELPTILTQASTPQLQVRMLQGIAIGNLLNNALAKKDRVDTTELHRQIVHEIMPEIEKAYLKSLFEASVECVAYEKEVKSIAAALNDQKNIDQQLEYLLNSHKISEDDKRDLNLKFNIDMTLPPKDIIPHVTDKDGLLAALLKAINTHIRQEKYDEFCRKQGESIDPKVPILAKVVKNLVDGNDLNKDDRKTLGDLQLSREIQQRILAARQRTSAAIGKQGAHLMAGNKFDINAAARLIAVEAG